MDDEIEEPSKATIRNQRPHKQRTVTDRKERLAAHLVLDKGYTLEQAAQETEIGSEHNVKIAVAKERGRREQMEQIDPTTLTLTAQQKLENAIRQQKRKIEQEFEQRILAEVRRRMEETVLPYYQASHAEHLKVIKSRKGIMDRATYRKILSCLHPDRVQDPNQKKRYEEAFRLFTEMEKLLLDEKESPTASFDMPRTYSEWEELKRRTTAERRAQRSNKGSNVGPHL